MMKPKLQTLTLFIALICFSVITQPVAAQQQKFSGLILRTPAQYGGFTFEFSMKRGETRCDSFIAQHDFAETTKEFSFYTMAQDYEVDPQTQEPVLPKGKLVLDGPYSLASWITIPDDLITLPRWGVEKNVNFCITVPHDATPGAHYATILLSTITKQQYLDGYTPIDTNGATLATRTGVNVLVTVDGDAKQSIQISGVRIVDIDGNGAFLSIFEYQPLSVVVDMFNDGNQFVKPQGNLSIHTGNLAEPVLFTPFNPSGNRILPQTRMSIATPWNDGPLYVVKDQHTDTDTAGNPTSSSSYRLTLDTTKLNNLRFGHYYATLQMLYYDVHGQLQRMPDFTVEFWIIPWKLILAIIAAIVIPLLVRRSINRYKRKRTRKKLPSPFSGKS